MFAAAFYGRAKTHSDTSSEYVVIQGAMHEILPSRKRYRAFVISAKTCTKFSERKEPTHEAIYGTGAVVPRSRDGSTSDVENT